MAKKKEEKKETKSAAAEKRIPRLKTRYREQIVPEMMKDFNWSNPHRVPRLEKICLNMGVGEGSRNIKVLEEAIEDLTTIASQKPLMTRARKSIAGFKLREGMPVGCFVTLRGTRMFDFLDKLVSIALPRIRDFQGLNSNSFDGHGNFTLGITEQLVFPEVRYDDITAIRGLDVTLVTTAKNDEEALALLTKFGMPIGQRS
jgi:large subunit ribosomal protein L5